MVRLRVGSWWGIMAQARLGCSKIHMQGAAKQDPLLEDPHNKS